MPAWTPARQRWAVFIMLGTESKEPKLWQRQGADATKTALKQQSELYEGVVFSGVPTL